MLAFVLLKPYICVAKAPNGFSDLCNSKICFDTGASFLALLCFFASAGLYKNCYMTFQDFVLSDAIQRAVREEGYTQPTPIQQQAIPLVLEGKDLLACAQTGTGKTAAFTLPVLQQLMRQSSGAARNDRRPLRALILTPTRELAIQIQESIEAYGRYLPLRSAVIFGGVSAAGQIQTLQRGIDILVATPGRLLDLKNQGYVNFSALTHFVLDEADRMLDMGFIHDVKRVIASLPAKRQSLFFSATMPPEIVRLAASILSDPAKVEVTPVSSTAETIGQSVYFVEKGDKLPLLVSLLQNPAIESALVFTRTKHGADKVAKALARFNISAAAIHGNKSQNARQLALNNFKSRTTRVLVATDIAARGIDVDELSHVINFEIPNIPETYVHRIGRTGRAGASGRAFSFCDTEERAYLRDIERLIKRPIPVATLPAGLAVTPAAEPMPAARAAAHAAKPAQPQPRAARPPAPMPEGGRARDAGNKKRRWYGKPSMAKN
jgi:ATP-dependent RNA helicase RhlE